MLHDFLQILPAIANTKERNFAVSWLCSAPPSCGISIFNTIKSILAKECKSKFTTFLVLYEYYDNSILWFYDSVEEYKVLFV